MALSKKLERLLPDNGCKRKLYSIQDTMDILGGKWKISIIGTLGFGDRHYMELQREIGGIGSKMLSKELQELEMNGLVKRNVQPTKPVTVKYELTPYGKTIQPIIEEMAKWGEQHRQRIIHLPASSVASPSTV